MTTMTADRRTARARSQSDATAKNERLAAMIDEIAAWAALAGFAVACFIVFAMAIAV